MSQASPSFSPTPHENTANSGPGSAGAAVPQIRPASNLLMPDHVPLSTYRLQLRTESFTLDDAAQQVSYLKQLGIGDAYLSPLFTAREGSMHGYDVVDHGTVEPNFGGEEALGRLAQELNQARMGLLLDCVPNHMGIDDPKNLWWEDVLRHGEGSRYASYFDIDWESSIGQLQHKVLLPILGDYFGKVLEQGDLKLSYDRGNFYVNYYQRKFPVTPAALPPVLRVVLDKLGDDFGTDSEERMELESLVLALDRLPAPSERSRPRMRERYRESRVAAQRLRALTKENAAVRAALDAAISEYNGTPGDPTSFDRLEALLDAQAYRLAFWRVAGDEINYRRFFDINELAAIRVEEPAVFDAVHALIFRLLARGWVTGLRIDHPDGLFDPPKYFDNLQKGYRRALADRAAEQQAGQQQAGQQQAGQQQAVGTIANPLTVGNGTLYVVAEKILAHDERLDPQWPVCGTTGYEFMNQLNGLFVAENGAEAMRGVYERFIGRHEAFRDVLYEGKRVILNFSMSSELHVLSNMLHLIASRRRESRDFTEGTLRRVLREVVASFPVYRTYVRPNDNDLREEDHRRVQSAMRLARRRNPELPRAVFDFLASILLLKDPVGLTDDHRDERRRFVLKLQQVTGPVMAKGLEDTSFYRYYPLASLNEVGGEPNANGVMPAALHKEFQQRFDDEPFTLSATATHDTKRGEDMRARLNVLSEIPDRWEELIGQWRFMNAAHKTDLDGTFAPDPNETYLIWQTFVGTWPIGEGVTETYTERLLAYFEKAFREAKVHTGWLDPDSDYEAAIAHFVRNALNGEQQGEFLATLDEFVKSIDAAGRLNSLSQVLVKATCPGVPDFYQGCELWDFHLVDPDNRQPVDYAHRRSLLDALGKQTQSDRLPMVREMVAQWPDERLKMYLTWQALQLRQQHPDLFLKGEYLPLEVTGERANHLFAFGRKHENLWSITAVPRLTADAPRSSPGQIASDWWGDTSVAIPPSAPQTWENRLTGETLELEGSVRATRLFAEFPVALQVASHR